MKPKQRSEPAIKTEEATLPLKSHFSTEEIANLLGEFESVISTHKAKEQGFDPENMIKTVRGGKVVWVSKDEMNSILSKQRKISGKSFFQKNEADEAANAINQRAQKCKALVDQVRKIASDDSNYLIERYRQIEAALNISLSRSQELRIIENAIRRKRKEDPIFQSMEEASQQLRSAVESQNADELAICQNYCDRHAEEFMSKHQRLEPYIQKADEHRHAYVEARKQFLQRQLDLIYQCLWVLEPCLDELLYHDKQGGAAGGIVEKFHQLEHAHAEAKIAGLEALNAKADPLALLERLNEWDRDHLQNLVEQALRLAVSYNDAWRLFVKADKRPFDELEAKPKQGMAFQNKKQQ